nr:alkaline phosphatase family protein [uncultured Flavobacterium sp.]
MGSNYIKNKVYFKFNLLNQLLNKIILLLVILMILISYDSTAQNSRKKVVVISLDGTPDYLVDKYLENGVLPKDGAFAKMKKNGAFASTLLPINVASTGPSHISIFTGSSPSKTGVIGNSFRSRNQKWESPNLTAFKQDIKSETIFQAAMRQGKKVMTLAGVGIDYTNKNRMTDFMFMYPLGSGPSLVIDLKITDTISYINDTDSYIKLQTNPESPSQPFYEVYGKFKIPLQIYIKNLNFSPSSLLTQKLEIVVDTDDNLKNGYNAVVNEDNWSEIEINKEGKKYISSLRITKFNEKNGSLQLLITVPAEVYGFPGNFLQKLELNCGLWPGEPENRKQTSGLVSEKIWFEQLDRLSKYSKNLILTGMKENEWDLLFGYFSTLDDVQHRYTLTNPRQIDFFADNGKRPEIYSKYIQAQFQKIDSYLLEIINALPKEANLIIFSDHGMVPIHTTLLLNNYFNQKGFNESKQNIKIATSGNSAHIYINKEYINSKEYDNYKRKLIAALQTLKDEETGELIFELVANQKEQIKYGLFDSDFSGDLFVSCKQGYSISERIVPDANFLVKNSFDPIMFEKENQRTKEFLINGTMNETGRAVHGNLSTIREGQSIFYAIGPDVPRKEIKEMYSLQIAPTIAKLLGIEPPANAEMKSGF